MTFYKGVNEMKLNDRLKSMFDNSHKSGGKKGSIEKKNKLKKNDLSAAENSENNVSTSVLCGSKSNDKDFKYSIVFNITCIHTIEKI